MYGRSAKSNGIAHNWAHQIVSKYKKDTGEGSNFFYEGKTIYSYGRHFPIAVIHEDKKRGNVTFLTTRGYSNTTSGHISAVRSACSHHTVIYCSNPDQADGNVHTDNLNAWELHAKDISAKLDRANKPEIYLSKIANERNEALIYAKYFGIKLTAKKYPFLFIESKDGGNKASELELKKKKAFKIQQEKEQKEAFELALKRFYTFTNRKGEYTNQIGGIYDPKQPNATYLRYNISTKRIETSKNVEIPNELAKRFYNWIKATIKKGGCEGECKYKILDFTVDYVNPKEFKVGCHTIYMTEADKIAKQLKW